MGTSRKPLVGLASVAIAAVAVGGAVAASGQAPSGADTSLKITSQKVTRELGPVSFCAEANGEPIALACRTRALRPGGSALPASEGHRITLRFGAPVRKLFVTWERIGPHGEIIPLNNPEPRRPSGAAASDPTVWAVTLTRDNLRARSISVLVIYDRPVSLVVGGRTSDPFSDATATFRVGLRPPIR